MSAKTILDFSITGDGHCTLAGVIVTDYTLEVLQNQGATSLSLQRCWLHTDCVEAQHSVALDSCTHCIEGRALALRAPHVTLWNSSNIINVVAKDLRCYNSAVTVHLKGCSSVMLNNSLAAFSNTAEVGRLDLNQSIVRAAELKVGTHNFLLPRTLHFGPGFSVLYDSTHVLLGSDTAYPKSALCTATTEGSWWRRQITELEAGTAEEFPDAEYFWALEQILANNPELLK